jgi:hypothetical protein
VIENILTKYYKTTVLLPKLFFFQGRYYPPKLCEGTRLQVKHLSKNITEATVLT